MRFRAIPAGQFIGEAWSDALVLRPSNWDDWFKFQTTYSLSYFDKDGNSHHIGATKLGRVGLMPAQASDEPRLGYRRPDPPLEFESLPEEFFSLGQDTSFYENLTKIGERFRENVLEALRDIAYDSRIFSLAADEEVTKVSLLREVPLPTVREQFARLARGGALLTAYEFEFAMPSGSSGGVQMDFAVEPNSKPPSNIHVLIGRNGVGKSTLLHRLTTAFVSKPRQTVSETSRSNSEPSVSGIEISNLVSVSFSAFDVFEPISVPRDRTKGLTYHYVGLKKINPKKDEVTTKDPVALSREMTISAKLCLQGARRVRWIRAIQLLESDPIFAEVGLVELIEGADDEGFLSVLPDKFKRLSSGHKIVLLTITRLVETVVEKSLVLLDEPEAHLHPPLLSAFVRALSDLLTNRNGLAVIATHSPVVLQEVPRSCVWKLQRRGSELTASRPELETFGENVGTLTDEVFGLEVTSTGFHKLLTEAAQNFSNYEEALESFAGHLGFEGRAILRARILAAAPRNLHVEG